MKKYPILCTSLFIVLASFLIQPKISIIYPAEASANQLQPKASIVQPRAVLSLPAPTKDTSTSSINAYIRQQAEIMGINPNLATCIVSHESQFVPTKLGPEKVGVSQGLWQIYSKAWPSITRGATFNVTWSTNWALTQIKAGHIAWWSTYSAKPFYCKSIPVYL